jgi:carbon monoxide dehydrogenase subunit G
LEPGARIVTFANGMIVREPIVTIDETDHRLVWSAEGGRTTHFNASAQVVTDQGQTKVVWMADLLPDEVAGIIEAAMEMGAQAMKKSLDRLANIV